MVAPAYVALIAEEKLPKIAESLAHQYPAYSRRIKQVSRLLIDQRDEIERLRDGISDMCSCQFPGDVCKACWLLGERP